MDPRGNTRSTSLASNPNSRPPVDTLSPGQLGPLFAALVLWNYCGEPPHTHSLHSIFWTPQSPNPQLPISPEPYALTYILTGRPISSFRAGIYRQWSCLQLHQTCQSALGSFLSQYWDSSLSERIHTLNLPHLCL